MTIAKTQFNNFPKYLQEYKYFCLWRYEERNGRLTKVPYNPNTPTIRAQSNNRDTFADLETTVNAFLTEYPDIEYFSGIGIGIFDDIGAIDIDHCIDEAGNLSAMAINIVHRLNTYTEVSPSGTGLRLLFRVPNGWTYNTDAYYINNQKAGLEIYLPNMTKKFVTVTGNLINAGLDMRDLGKEGINSLQEIINKYMKRPSQDQNTGQAQTEQFVSLSDLELLEKAKAARNGYKFTKLWGGDYSDYPSHSEADLALCILLAYWTGRDPERMDRLFRQSGLMRDKWDRRQSGTTYGAITTNTACNRCSEIYTGKPSAQSDFDALNVDYSSFANAEELWPQTDEKNAENAGEGAVLPGLLTYKDAVNIFETTDDRYIEFKAFPTFGKTAKIKLHDSVVLAAETGGGKSSLALNFLSDLNDEYPCIYINLEMDIIDVLRRLTAIYSGIELDRIEGYKHDETTAEMVNVALKAITSRKPLQVIQGAYMLQEIEEIIKRSTEGREEPTIVFIDHSLLVDTQRSTGSRYDRFTQVSEGLRRMALKNNIIVFVLLQQNRQGKANEDERPRNSSLKESGSWENDATQICFLWYDPTEQRKKLLLTKNRHGSCGEFPLNYWKNTQFYNEAAGGAQDMQNAGGVIPRKMTKREKQQQKLIKAFEDAYLFTFGKPTIRAMAEAADVKTSTIKAWIKEYGGCTIDGIPQDPAGVDSIVDYVGSVKLTPADDPEPENYTVGQTPKAGKRR